MPRKITPKRTNRPRRSRFNGAEAVMPRKMKAAMCWSSSAAVLQWGRGSDASEDIRRLNISCWLVSLQWGRGSDASEDGDYVIKDGLGNVASMGPRQ